MSSDLTHEEIYGTPKAKGDSASAPCSPPDWDAIKWRQLAKGEIIKEGDWVDMCRDGWRDDPKWVPSCSHDIGTEAPDPRYPSHRNYRRPISEENSQAIQSEGSGSATRPQDRNNEVR